MSVLQRRELSRMMRCCRPMYEAGVPLLLGNFPVEVADSDPPSKLDSLFSFVLGPHYAIPLLLPPPMNLVISRAHFIHEMNYQRTRLDPRMDRILATVWNGAHNLRILRLSTGGDLDELKLDPSICMAISSLTSIQTLSLTGLGTEECTMLQQLLSPLVVATINFPADAVNGLAPRDVLPLLTGFRASLENLCVLYTRFGDAQVEFPRVHSLSAHSCWLQFLRPLLISFPNLRRLSLIRESSHERFTTEIMEGLRKKNKEEQQKRMQRMWQKLEDVRSDVPTMFMLGLICEVHTLDIGVVDRSTLGMLHEVMKDTRPHRLTVSLDIMSMRTDRLNGLFNLAPQLTLLNLTLDLRSSQSAVDISALLAGVSSIIELLPNISVYFFNFLMEENSTTLITDYAFNHLVRLQHSTFAQQCLSLSPSPYLSLLILKLPAARPSFWTFDSEGSRSRVVRQVETNVGICLAKEQGIVVGD
ncbi:hypothetical protein C8Q75DRAFT_806211 [Abortiporus biennis]|nr:hypothetical protein C8Q75DRAFT_806211 [Abortiporus biennis]